MPGGFTSRPGSVALIPSWTAKRWKPRTATSVRAALAAASGACPSLPWRNHARKSPRSDSVTWSAAVIPRLAQNSRYRRRSRL